MITDAEKHGARLASQNDSRITPIGKIIRATRLDELPQLFNIFMGDMSIVGEQDIIGTIRENPCVYAVCAC